ncbi:Mrp/NBP35 family ATP-binding protein [uncultured Thermanaerothrix sp.]|uniref:Mrp/NBP35 family ATP-binding protein n=1 Tax=uncultured Thermanaerothrix sp. TaxID=1195149 RepID=UPI002602F1E2|nr:Mrp/NBP35 family ATP-binding protein [uncultured Thermanaerothrix sp.]
MSPNTLSQESLLAALRQVKDPELGRDIVSLNMVRRLEMVDGVVEVEIVLTTPACPLRDQITDEVKAALLSLPGVKEVKVSVQATVASDGRIRGSLQLPVKNAVAVASGKGGVGKTTVAVNLAVALAKEGATVGLMDADIYGPNVPTMLGVDRLPPFQGEKLVPAEAFGVKVMSIGFLVPQGKPLIWRGPMLHSAIRQFLSDVSWGELDYLIIDLPPGTGDAPLSLAQSIPLTGAVIVTLPQAVSVEDAARSLEMFRELNVPILGVIENMSFLELPDGSRVDVFGQGGGEKLAQKAGVPFLGSIPLDPAVRIGGDHGSPIVLAQPESASAKALLNIARRLAAQISITALQGEQPLPKIEITG